jgi:DoxX-like family
MVRLACVCTPFRTPAVEISLAAPARTDVKTDIAKKLHGHGNCASRDDNPLLGKIVGERLYETFVPQCVQVGGSPFSQPVARHDAGANHPILRSTDNTKNDNRFHGRRIIQWRTNDCATAAFLKEASSDGETFMNVALWLVAGVLAAAFADTGSLKLTQSNQALSALGMTWTEDFSPATVKFISVAEVAGALGVILPALLHVAPALVPVAAAALAVVTAGAVLVHLRRKERVDAVPAVVLGLLAVFLAWGRFGPYAF